MWLVFSSGILFLLSALALLLFFFFYMENYLLMMEWLILNYGCIKFSFLVFIDCYSFLFLFVVFLVSSMVMIYSFEYMGQWSLMRFNLLLMMFILSMVLMIISPSVLSILLGWDGLGLISYCLVVFYQSKMAYNSGMLTMLCNRVGDVGLLLLVSLCLMMGSFNILVYNLSLIMMLLLILCSLTKSAQFPFSSWLPAAMMAPTPISSLVHSSTLVTAGVYLMIRYSNLLMLLDLNFLLLFISSFTMFMAGLIANFEYDFKKIIALSTLSQLGLMFSILGIGMYNLSFFHLLVHALFKSMMFMGVGILIHNLDTQDLRKYGNIMILYPYVSFSMSVSVLCLCGFPFMAGFYSKDLIMEILFMNKISILSLVMLILATVFTVSYSVRMILFVFFGSVNYFGVKFIGETYIMSIPLFILSLFLFFVGSYLLNLFFFDSVVVLTWFFKMLLFYLMLFGMMLGYLFYMFKLKLYSLGFFFSSMFYLNYFYKSNYIGCLKIMFFYNLLVEKNLFDNFFGLNFLKLFYYFSFIKFSGFFLLIFVSVEVILFVLLLNLILL